MIPLPLICFIYFRKALHYPELSVQSQGGPLLDCILHMCSIGVYGAYCNLILSVLPGYILTMINNTP
jgi:hypothetical protein